VPDKGIKLSRFSGIAPRMATELLPESLGQVALNCKVTSGDLVPYHESRFLVDTLVEDPLAIYPIIIDDVFYWMMWQTDVDVIRSPVPTVSQQKFYFSGARSRDYPVDLTVVPKATDINRATFFSLVGGASKNAPYTVVLADYEKRVEFSVGNISCYLPSVATAKNQFVILVVNSGSVGGITLDPDGTELVNGVSTFEVPTQTKYLVKCDGTGWTATPVLVFPYDYFDLGVPVPSSPCVISYDTVLFGPEYLGSGDLNFTGQQPTVVIV